MTHARNTQSGTDSAIEDVLAVVGHVLLGLVRALLVVVWWAVLFPMISVPVGVAVAVWVLVGWQAGVAVAGVSVAGIMLVRVKRREMFERLVTQRARARFLTWWRYTRRWTTLLDHCGLTRREGGVVVACPLLRSVRIGATVDRLQVKMLAGQCPADYENRSEHLAHAFGALDCRVVFVGPGLFELTFRRGDALAEPITVPARHLGLPRNSATDTTGKEAA
ncbi:hypothetical protein [Nocardia terpenica]|uniref:Uncharacterized protein n=1 Tax=Nocardia terpenica TaxID=455432 RepID=A0A164PWB1_9NOCA|nr:hypothetical protein [Nocardia terpenica]KZM76160.1 hypothetical protein AWN90_00060 [Nocardia terpenica]NQE90348.1 hypothetical protein [Nocardia terpenica]